MRWVKSDFQTPISKLSSTSMEKVYTCLVRVDLDIQQMYSRWWRSEHMHVYTTVFHKQSTYITEFSSCHFSYQQYNALQWPPFTEVQWSTLTQLHWHSLKYGGVHWPDFTVVWCSTLTWLNSIGPYHYHHPQYKLTSTEVHWYLLDYSEVQWMCPCCLWCHQESSYPTNLTAVLWILMEGSSEVQQKTTEFTDFTRQSVLLGWTTVTPFYC